jgi:hypothetical protein
VTASWAVPLAHRHEGTRGHVGRVWIAGQTFRGVCSCSWTGPARATRADADLDAVMHTAGLTNHQEYPKLT